MSREIDARGLLCPEPVLLTRRELAKMASGILRVRVNSAAAKENVTRLAESMGWEVETASEGDGFVLTLRKPEKKN
ncbi:MAG: sulfurtransferase TusA family protein [Desulfotomaculales bacterium]